jgi:hypothetical protein
LKNLLIRNLLLFLTAVTIKLTAQSKPDKIKTVAATVTVLIRPLMTLKKLRAISAVQPKGAMGAKIETNSPFHTGSSL